MTPPDDQRDVIAFLSDPSTWGAKVEVIATHGSQVFLTGDRAFKLKRAVKFPYMDFSTPARREAMVKAELRLNRRTAPELYRAAVAVTREADGRLALGGQGDPVDWLVEMARFEQDQQFDRLARRGALTDGLADAVGQAVARFHAVAARRHDLGGAEEVERTVMVNYGELQRHARALDLLDQVNTLCDETYAALGLARDRLDRRRIDGFVRVGHGDLHLANICLYEGRPLPFDAIEFYDLFTVTDQLYDLAFLLMDVWLHDLPVQANRMFNEWLAATGDFGGLSLMPLYLALRSAIRAHVGGSMAESAADEVMREKHLTAARNYVHRALEFLKPAPPRLVAVGGLSGTGKSVLSRALAAYVGRAPGAVVLRSDVIRRELAGAPPTGGRLGQDHYTPEASAAVYAEMRARARICLDAGQAVIADAVHARPDERAVLEDLAGEAGVPFKGFWLEAPVEVLARRLDARRDDASDADTGVLRQQLTYDLGEIGWTKLVSAGDAAATLAAARAAL